MTDVLSVGYAELVDVNFQYPGSREPVFRRQSWQIEAGTFCLIAGSSGSGKSTFLRLLNGLVPHFSGGDFGGRIRIGGLDTLSVPTRELSRSAGFVFQDADSTAITGQVEDEIAFGLEQLAVPVAAMRRQVEEMLTLLGIEQLRGRRISTLSGGERQRVSIAAAMARNPHMLILDEPTSQLDPAGAEDMVQALHRLNEEQGMTIVLAEHRLERVVSLADRLTILELGSSLVDGAPRDVFACEGRQFAPALFRAGEHLGWNPMPLSVREGRRSLQKNSSAIHSRPASGATSAGSVAVGLSGVELRHDHRIVLRDIDLAFRQGEVTAIMGPNGSGKTTLLRSIVGIHHDTRGMILLNGSPVSPSESIGLTAGFLPQRSRSLLFRESVRDEIEFSLQRRGASRDSADALIEEFGLSRLQDRHPHDISVGEQESLALAVTVAGDPPILLLDEPTRGMDAPRKERLAASLAGRARQGQCVLLATHDVEFAAVAADRVVLLGGGRVVADGSPRDVMDGSLVYGTQLNRVFGRGLLTLEDVINATTDSELGDTAENSMRSHL